MPFKTTSYPSRRNGARRRNGVRSPKSAQTYNVSRTSVRRGPKKDYIDSSRFIKVATPSKQIQYTAQHQFDDFEINERIKTNLVSKGFKTPTPIQDKAIPHALNGRDIIGIADTGTGKTAAFTIPLLQAAITKNARALIIAPTRELAQQIETDILSMAIGSNLATAVLIGGAGMGYQARDLRQKPSIVVGTPGRLKDHIERGNLRLQNFKFVVLDEVDRMLDMGFVNDVRTILGQLSPQRQSFFFSATLDTRVNALIDSFANDPITISVKTGTTGENIHQNIVKIRVADNKVDKLHDLLITSEITKTIIFDDTKRSVEKLCKELIARGFKADAIHGGKSQGQRQRSLKKFRQNEIAILVATDVAARGIDVNDVSHVINYSPPNTYDDYVHRIGRAGRAGKTGHALTFIDS